MRHLSHYPAASPESGGIRCVASARDITRITGSDLAALRWQMKHTERSLEKRYQMVDITTCFLMIVANR